MSRKPVSPRSASVVDKEIARRIKAIRLAKDVTQTALADTIGVTFQQVQKYEGGVSRVSAGRLYLIAGALGAPISAFYGE